ncbi:MAG: ATP-binding protein, partial [Lachnospiraceae bacterium]|nr:ATP-binding protein [Lachnospiraceae bacterium]
MLSGRIAELQYLEQYYEKTGSQMLVVYGQKHIGKTALLREFSKEKQSHYYLAKPCSEREQLYQWGMQLRAVGMEAKEFPDLQDVLELICAGGGKKIIVIDEFQHIAKTSESFMNGLVHFMNGLDEKNGVMVLLCSSAIGWVENSMITKIGEAAHALSGLLKIRALSFADLVHRFPDFRIEECVEAYSILGGLPGLWNQFDDKLTIQQNICRHILNRDSYLFEEWDRMVAEQLRETSVYNTILAAIASGKYKLNDIYLHTGFSRAKISVYLKNLMELELVEKVFSYDMADKENMQKGIYRIIHPFVNFYFTYMYPYMSAL